MKRKSFSSSSSCAPHLSGYHPREAHFSLALKALLGCILSGRRPCQVLQALLDRLFEALRPRWALGWPSGSAPPPPSRARCGPCPPSAAAGRRRLRRPPRSVPRPPRRPSARSTWRPQGPPQGTAPPRRPPRPAAARASPERSPRRHARPPHAPSGSERSEG